MKGSRPDLLLLIVGWILPIVTGVVAAVAIMINIVRGDQSMPTTPLLVMFLFCLLASVAVRRDRRRTGRG